MKELPLPSKKRLLTLSNLLSQQPQEKMRITSAEIAKLTGWGEATIRRDISLLELHTGKSNGYELKSLKTEIDKNLGLIKTGGEKHNCCIVGLGSLGQAFLENSVFLNENFALVAGFDSNQNRVELIKSKIPLFPTLDLEKTIRQQKIEFAILTVDDSLAQKMTDRLVSYGIKGIVNYTNAVLTVPENFRLENASPEKSLANLL